MGLWDAGKINHVTSAIILRVCEQARKDHTFTDVEDPSYYPPVDIPAPDMPINELVELDPAKGDGAFDRCSHSMHVKEIFHLNGNPYRVVRYYGPKNWIAVPERDAENWENVDQTKFSEEELADVLTKQNGPHPNPYVARIEVTYSSKGARAGYGIRKDGTCDCWYD